jgi:hypothetical protein
LPIYAASPTSDESLNGLMCGSVTEDILKNCSEFNDSPAGKENRGFGEWYDNEMD